MKKVAIIDIDAPGGKLYRGIPQYRALIELFERVLQEAGAEVRLCGHLNTARGWLGGAGAATFVTWDSRDVAEQFAEKNPGIRVSLWSGAAQEAGLDKVVLALKPPRDNAQIVRVILG